MNSNHSSEALTSLLTTPQVAQMLGLDRSTVWRKWKAGELKAAGTISSKNGIVPLFSRDYIDLYAQSRKSA